MGDEVIADASYSPNPLVPPDSDDYKKFVMINSANHVIKYYDMDYLKLVSSPLLRDVASNILNKYRSRVNLTQEKYPLKYKLYSAHDTTMSPILITLGLLDRDCLINQAWALYDFKCPVPGKPPIASSINWQLIEVGPEEHYVRTSFRGEYFNFCNLKPSQMRKVDQKSDKPKYDCTLE